MAPRCAVGAGTTHAPLELIQEQLRREAYYFQSYLPLLCAAYSRCTPVGNKTNGDIVLREAKEFQDFKLRATDGDIGKPRDFLFDDKHWTVRYLVAETGGWLMGREVLISPYALAPANYAERVLPVSLTKKQIEGSPALASHQPVSRQYESSYYDYYSWPNYGFGPYAWGVYPSLERHQAYERALDLEQDWDPHLRSTTAVTGHHIQALDAEVGHVEGFIIDDETWSIRYLVVDTKNWWPGKRVLVAPQWIERVSWQDAKVFLNLPRERIKQAPEYKPESLNRDYERSLYHHYDRPNYWDNEHSIRDKWVAAGAQR